MESSEAFCKNCSAEVTAPSRFCGRCGQAAEDSSPSRPTRPGLSGPAPPVSDSELGLAEEVQTLSDSDFAAAIDSEVESESDAEALPLEGHEVFLARVALILGVVRDFLLELEFGEPRGAWLRECCWLLERLAENADELGLSELVAATRELVFRLSPGGNAGFPDFTRSERGHLSAAYANLERLVPGMSTLAAERARREPIFVRSILAQVSGLGSVPICRLERAGLTSLPALARADANQLAAAGAIDHEVAKRILDQVARFKQRLGSVLPDAARTGERDALRRLIDALRTNNAELRALKTEWSRGAVERRRGLRSERELIVSRVEVALADLGESELAESLTRMPFDRKVKELTDCLSRLSEKHEPLKMEASTDGRILTR